MIFSSRLLDMDVHNALSNFNTFEYFVSEKWFNL